MQREIKFRGKRLDTKEWIYGDLLTFNNTDCEITDWSMVDCSRYDVDKRTVGQFTGLNDMDDKEIYEGDVVDYVCDGPQQGIVIYDNFGCVSIEFGDDEYVQTINLRLLILMTVIGNIHDNPELTRK